MAKAHGLYDNSPTLKRGEDGKVAVKRPEKKEDKKEEKKGDGEEENAGDGLNVRDAQSRREMRNRHIKEHIDLHARHEADHDGGGKEDMSERHHGEYKEMHSRHQSEMKKMHSSHAKAGTEGETLGTPVKDIEKGAKE